MRKPILSSLPGMLLIITSLIFAQNEDRLGFEYNEAEPWDHPKHDLLLEKLKNVTGGGDINVNVLAGGWHGMQPSAVSMIDFSISDQIVKLFGRYEFSLAWNLLPNAAWAYPNKPDCQPDTVLSVPIFTKHCAPEPDFEGRWTDYVKAVVERYDGDGLNDMPGLTRPVRIYIMTGEIKFGKTGKGDAEKGPFWYDSIDNLLRFHRLTYQAIREADPSGNTKLVSSGGVLFDLFADFPDYPEFDSSDPNHEVPKRLAGDNFRGSLYAAGWDSLKKMLNGFGNDADGIECDWIGWHPHFSWRVIDQEFAFIHALAGNKPVYVDDMWCNLFPVGYASVPGEAQFNASPSPNREWVTAINGDFPNSLFTTNDPYGELFQKLNGGNQRVLEWYNASGARRLVKSFVSAFGEGAIHVSFSGTNDMLLLNLFRGWELGWINLTGTQQEGYSEKPQFYTMRLLAKKLRGFTRVTEIPVSEDPRTRVYRFDRPEGPVYVLWSETGSAPPGLDYRIPTGETVTLDVESDSLMITHIVTDTINKNPVIESLTAENQRMTLPLGYEPIFLETVRTLDVPSHPSDPPIHSFSLDPNYPNPFNPETRIHFILPEESQVVLNVFDLMGREVATLINGRLTAGPHMAIWNGAFSEGTPASSGIYICRLTCREKDRIATKHMKIVLVR